MERADYSLKERNGDLEDWEMILVVLIASVCILLIIIAIIFAIANQLCGHCVICADATSDLTKACTNFLKKRYGRLDEDEEEESFQNTNLPSAENPDLSKGQKLTNVILAERENEGMV